MFMKNWLQRLPHANWIIWKKFKNLRAALSNLNWPKSHFEWHPKTETPANCTVFICRKFWKINILMTCRKKQRWNVARLTLWSTRDVSKTGSHHPNQMAEWCGTWPQMSQKPLLRKNKPLFAKILPRSLWTSEKMMTLTRVPIISRLKVWFRCYRLNSRMGWSLKSLNRLKFLSILVAVGTLEGISKQLRTEQVPRG